MMTMKEACAYQVRSRREKCETHRLKVIDNHGVDGIIQGFTESEHRKVKTRGKTSFNKGKKPAFNSIWRHYDLPKIK